MNVRIADELVPERERRARTIGLEAEGYVSSLLARDLKAPRTLDEVLGAFREQVKLSGIADPELAELFRAARDEAAIERPT